MPDVKNTIARAREILEHGILFGSTLPTASYADVLTLCKAYGERPPNTAVPLNPSPGNPPTPGARVAVQGVRGSWVGCAGIEVALVDGGRHAPAQNPRPDSLAPRFPGQISSRFEEELRLRILALEGAPVKVSPPEPQRVTVKVRNTRREWISVSLTSQAVIVQLPTNNTLPSANRVEPGDMVFLTLTHSSNAPAGFAQSANVITPRIPADMRRALVRTLPPTVGFVLPANRS